VYDTAARSPDAVTIVSCPTHGPSTGFVNALSKITFAIVLSHRGLERVRFFLFTRFFRFPPSDRDRDRDRVWLLYGCTNTACARASSRSRYSRRSRTAVLNKSIYTATDVGRCRVRYARLLIFKCWTRVVLHLCAASLARPRGGHCPRDRSART